MKQQAGALLEQVVFLKVTEGSSDLSTKGVIRLKPGAKRLSTTMKAPVKAPPQLVGASSCNGQNQQKSADDFFEEF